MAVHLPARPKPASSTLITRGREVLLIWPQNSPAAQGRMARALGGRRGWLATFFQLPLKMHNTGAVRRRCIRLLRALSAQTTGCLRQRRSAGAERVCTMPKNEEIFSESNTLVVCDGSRCSITTLTNHLRRRGKWVSPLSQQKEAVVSLAQLQLIAWPADHQNSRVSHSVAGGCKMYPAKVACACRSILALGSVLFLLSLSVDSSLCRFPLGLISRLPITHRRAWGWARCWPLRSLL